MSRKVTGMATAAKGHGPSCHIGRTPKEPGALPSHHSDALNVLVVPLHDFGSWTILPGLGEELCAKV